jgi:polar amino acid transport system substrate-binding protein
MDDVSDNILKKEGFKEPLLIRVSSLTQMLMMLKNNRVTLICATEASIKKAFLENPQLKFAYETQFELSRTEVYYAFSKDVDDELISRYQKALNSIDPERQKIISRYFPAE